MRYAPMAVVCLAALAGCQQTGCPTRPNPFVLADVRDSVTGAPAAHRSSLVVEGAGYYDSTSVAVPTDSLVASQVVSGSPGRTGEYTVRIRRSGYRLWERRDVHIEGSGCSGANAVILTVRLQPLP